MQIKTKAIVLHSFKYNDNRLIVDLFTLDCGRVSVAVTVSSGKRAKFRKTLFAPLTLLCVEIDVRQRVGLQKLIDASLESPMTSIPFLPDKTAIALFISEFLYHALKGEQVNRPLFNYVSDSIEFLDLAEGHYANFHMVFLLRLSLFLGFMPNLEDYADGDIFDLRSSTFVKVIPPHKDYLNVAEAALIGNVMRMNFRTMHLFRLTHADRNRLLDILIAYYRCHLPEFPDLNSLPVLRELYSVVPTSVLTLNSAGQKALL